MLNWEKLLNPVRRKDKAESTSSDKDKVSMDTASGRDEIERDYDRILFATPTRRLADKTQVFPLDKNDSVRTRLTHSHEVSNLARSIGVRLAFDYPNEVFGNEHVNLNVKRTIPALLATIGLVHDLGNPAFGHQGEVAIQEWFKKNNKKVFGKAESDGIDFFNFDGNAQTFRLLTRLQILNDDFGLNLTYATLAALVKYPSFWNSDTDKKGGYKKSGIFLSEKEIIEEVWNETGLKEGVRHPLTYIMEACDDIAYAILDAEDTVKKSLASFYDLVDFLQHHAGNDPIVKELLKKAGEKNKEFKDEDLSSSELNDLSMQMLRVKAISLMIDAVTETYVSVVDELMKEKNKKGFDLIKESKAKILCETLKNFDKKYGYKHKSVLKLELQGTNYINSLMDMMWDGVDKENNSELFSKYVYGRISENYRRVYLKNDERSENYRKAQLLCDSISGMTDSYLISLHDELKPLYDGYRSKK